MKQRIAIAAAVVMIAIQFTAAQTPAVKLSTEEKIVAFATKNLLTALNSGNPGVVESAMRVTSLMAMRYPKADVNSLVEAINIIQQTNPSGTTRYKAYITMSICENPEWYAGDVVLTEATDETFFQEASARMQEQLLSANQ